jgi:sec-independent protein translocase protein TatA
VVVYIIGEVYMFNHILISTPGPTELIVILLLILVLFGAKRIPEIAQGLGKGIREFKKSMREVQDEIETSEPKKLKSDKEKKAEKKEDKQDG